MEPAGQLVVATDIRNTLFRRALNLLDEVHAGLEEFDFGGLIYGNSARTREEGSGSVTSYQSGATHAGDLVLQKGGDPLERLLAIFVQGRTSTARRAVGAVAQIHNEIDSILTSFEREFPPTSSGANSKSRLQGTNVHALTGQPSEEVLKIAAATTAAAARFRVQAAEAAKSALYVYDNAAKQAAAAAQATTQALEMQIRAEQHSAAGNLPQALDSIRQANRLRDESAEAARLSRQFQKEYSRHRREAQEAHLQADAAMRYAYSLEREALKSSSEAADRQHAMWKERYERLTRQADELRAQASSCDAEADAALARAQQAQHQADSEMAQGNYDLGNSHMQEAVRSQEQAGYARAQAKAARDSLQRLMPNLQAARERMEEAERDVEDLSQRQARLQDSTTKQRTDRLHEEADELAALCDAAEGAALMHEDLTRVYEERLAQDRQRYDNLSSEGRTAEADALAVHIKTWEELLDVARKNLHASRAEAKAMRKRLAELSKADVSKDPTIVIHEGAEDFQLLREAKDKEVLAMQAVTILARSIASSSFQDVSMEDVGPAGDRLLLQTEIHRQRIARLAEQMDKERRRLEDGLPLSGGDEQSSTMQAEALVDSIAMSHLVGTLETTRLLQLWKQRSEQAVASAEEMRKTWAKLDHDAAANADEAARLEEQALVLEMAGRKDEASSTLAQAEELHRIAGHLRLEADKVKSTLIARETVADNAQAQSQSLVQGLYDVEHAAGRLQSELGRRGYSAGDPCEPKTPLGQSSLKDVKPDSIIVPLERPSSVHDDEVFTAMMALPGRPSQRSSTAPGDAILAASNEMDSLYTHGGQTRAAKNEAFRTSLSRGSITASVRDQTAPSLRLDHSEPHQALDQMSRCSSIQQTSITHGCKVDIHNKDMCLAYVVQELELCAALASPDFSICRWEGHAELISALQAEGSNDHAILAISTELAACRGQLSDGSGLVEMQIHRDEQRKARWQDVIATLQPGADVLVAQVAEQTLDRCAAVVTAAKFTEDAMTLQICCQDAIISGITSYRLALVNQRMATESARLAQAEAVAMEQQVHDAHTIESDLLQQVQALQNQLANLESQGNTGQVLTMRFELQRLQNKHAEAAAQARQKYTMFTIAQQAFGDTQKKEADVKINVEALNMTIMTLGDAAKEASIGVQYAIEGYQHAVLALAIGAKADLSRLRAGVTNNVQSQRVDSQAVARVQTHFQQYADCIRQAQQSLEATRRLQRLADVGATPTLSPVNSSATSRANTNTSVNALQAEEEGPAVITSLPGSRQQTGVIRNEVVHGQSSSIFNQSSLHVDQRSKPSSGNPSQRASVDEQSSRSINNNSSNSVLVLSPAVNLVAVSGNDNPLISPSSTLLNSAVPRAIFTDAGRNKCPSIIDMSTEVCDKDDDKSSRGLGHNSGVVVPRMTNNGLNKQGPLSGTRFTGLGLSGHIMPASSDADTLPVSSPSAISAGQMNASVLSDDKMAISGESMNLSHLIPDTSGFPSSLLTTLSGLKDQAISIAPTSEQQSKGSTAADGPFGSLQAVLSGRLLIPSQLNGSIQGAATRDTSSFLPGVVETEQPCANKLAASPDVGNNFYNQGVTQRRYLDTAPSMQKVPAINNVPAKHTRVILPIQPAKDTKGSSGILTEMKLGLDSHLGPEASRLKSASSLHAAEPTSAPTASVSGRFQSQDSLPMASGPPIIEPQSQRAPVDELGFHIGLLDKSEAQRRLEPPTRGTVESTVKAATGHHLTDIMRIDAELASLHAHHQQQLSELSCSQKASSGEMEQDLSAVRQILDAELEGAKKELQSARAGKQKQQEYLWNASPAQVQGSYDLLQYHEERVMMLQQALAACTELAKDQESLNNMKEEKNVVDLEALQCEETLTLLAKAADMCTEAVQELKLQTFPDLGQNLAYVQDKAADVRQHQQQAQREAQLLSERQNQLKEKWASQQEAMKLHKDWMQQARKASEAAADTMAWDKRLAVARAGLQALDTPLQELQGKAGATLSAAKTMTSAAMQHRRQAEDLERQAAQQRDDAQCFWASGQHLEADAAQTMANSLQQQARGLLAQAEHVENDAQKLFLEADELGEAVERAHRRIKTETDIVEQVSRAHQMSVSVFHWSRTAALKLHDAFQKQNTVAEKRLALEQVERNLIHMEEQNPESGNFQATGRPDELASHMILIVRTKQEASRMRAALQMAQQQVDDDWDAANAAVREATKAEREREKIELIVQDLEMQANQDTDIKDVSQLPPRDGLQQDPPNAASRVELGSRVLHSSIQLLQEGEDVRAAASNGDLQSSLNAKVQLSSVIRTSAATQEAQQPTQLRVGLPILRTDNGKQDGTNHDSAHTESRLLIKRAGSPLQASINGRADGNSQQTDRAATPQKLRVAVVAVNDVRNSASVSAPPPTRLVLGASQPHPSASGVSSPSGSAAVGMAAARVDWSTQDHALTVSVVRGASQQEDARSDRSYSHTSTPAATGMVHNRLNKDLQPIAQHQNTGSPMVLHRIGAFRSPTQNEELNTGTAGALLDRVANKSLRPLSYLKLTNASGKPVAQPYQNRGSMSSFESSSRSNSANDGKDTSSSAMSSAGSHMDSNPKALPGDFEEEALAEENGSEPDSKMYRMMKQRVTDLEGRIVQLRRQGDTARTAAEILAHKQEQRRADMSAGTGSGEALQTMLLEHGDAMIHMKEAESGLCHRQAAFLEEEMAVCSDALQYAVVDWHYRKEMKRLEERCTALTERAQSRADEAQRFDAEAADASECIMLATSQAGSGSRACAATLEHQRIMKFIEEQQEQLKAARQRSAESRSDAVQISNLVNGGAARKLLVEKKTLCNKALYQSAVELAEVYDHAAKIVAKMHNVKLHGMKARADAIAEQIQQLEAEVASQHEQVKSSMVSTTSKLLGSQLPTSHSGQQGGDVLSIITRLSVEVEDAIQQQCLQEMVGETSDVLNVHRRRMVQISRLVQLYQASYDCNDHNTTLGDSARIQPLNEAAKRAASILAAQDAVHDLDRACGVASQLRLLCLDAAEAHVALFHLRADPGTVRAQLLGEKAHDLDQEELNMCKQRLALLEIEIPLARDQITAALQVLEYRQAAVQLVEAQKELEYVAGVAAEAVANLESTISIHQENIAMMHRYTNSALHEARIFMANGNFLQAAASEEAARRLANESLAAETSLSALIQDSQLKRDEQSLAGAAAEELQQVADGSLELVGLLLRIINLQQEVHVLSSRINELDNQHLRFEQEFVAQKSLADSQNKQAELLQHESLQCRTNLKFSAADARLSESRQCRINAQHHTKAVEAAKQQAAATAQHLKSCYHRRKQLLREVHLLHTAAGHLQGALSCMRDKHHLVRKLRDIKYQHREGQKVVDLVRSSSPVPVPEIDVLKTQVDASIATIKHHLSSKTSYVTAADNLHVAGVSLDRQAACTVQADATMQYITKARIAAATAGTQYSLSLSVPLLAEGHGNDMRATGSIVTAQATTSDLALAPPYNKYEANSFAKSVDAPLDAELKFITLQLQQAELQYRCLHGSLSILETIAVAAERASEARCQQVDLSDQAAILVSNLAAKILEAEACANEAASLEASVRVNAALLDDDDEENVKVKLMMNALLQKAESYRNEALLLQGRIKELEEQERAAGAKASSMEESLMRLQADHRHSLDALDLSERIQHSREQEAAVHGQMQTLAAEVLQLEREAKGMENKIAQLRQQLTNASHTACSEDVANVMLVMQQIDTKLALHRQLLRQRQLELESSQADCERLAEDISLMKRRTEYILHASETQEQVRQTAMRVTELESDLSHAKNACSQCESMLGELRQQYMQLGTSGGANNPESEAEASAPRIIIRQSQQMAATQAAITLAEQMLETHVQRVEVLQAAVVAWETAKQRQEALLRYQEQLMQQDHWCSTLEQYRAKFCRAAVGHREKAVQLRANGDKCSSRAALLLEAGPGATERLNDSPLEADVFSSIRAQAATIRCATEASEQHSQAEVEDALAARAGALAEGIGREIQCFSAVSDLAQPMYERLYLAANASVSVARLQLVCVGICSDQGKELSTMHEALNAVRGLAAKIQGLLEGAERHTLAGHNMEAATARGQATAIQDTLQQELHVVRLCKQRLTDLNMKMEGARQELSLADKRMAQVTRSAAATQSVTEYVHRACELRYECGERHWGTLQVLRQAANAAGRAVEAQRELKALQGAEKEMTQAGKKDIAAIVGLTVTALKRSLMEAAAERQLLDAQAVQEANSCGSEVAAAALYMELAGLTVKLLQHMDKMDMHQEVHEQLHASLETARRNQQALNALLVHRRGEMQNLTGQIETHRCESQFLQKMGNEAQAVVRQEATTMLTSQLAEIAEDVMKLETRYESLEQKKTRVSSLHAKSESCMDLLSHLARLCSAAVGHLLDARDAHDNHSAHVREAAVKAVELSKEETVLSGAELRIQQLRESLEELVQSKKATEMGNQDPNSDSHVKWQQEIILAQAELVLAHRQRAEAEQRMLAIRAQCVQAELAVQSSQLRITKARQRAEDAQQFVDNIWTLLNGSSVITIINLEEVLGPTSLVNEDMNNPPPVTGIKDYSSHPHGVLAAAQLHSVILQALTEAVLKFVQALDCSAAAEQRRIEALSSSQAAQTARDAAARQHAAAEELRLAAEEISMIQQVHQLTEGRCIRADDATLTNGGDCHAHSRGTSTGGQMPLSTTSLYAASDEQNAAAVAKLEVERLQHEAAYKEAAAAQESKLAACFLQQQKLLHLLSNSLLQMARFGIAAELNASPNMTADQASSLLAACKQLAEQHETTLMLGHALGCCKGAEEYLKASLQCIQRAKDSRDKVIDSSLTVLEDKKAFYMKESDPALPASVIANSRSPRESSASRTAVLPPGAVEEEAAKATAQQAERYQLMVDEEHMLVQVQELDKAASECLEDSNTKVVAFKTEWASLMQPIDEMYQLIETPLAADSCAAPVDTGSPPLADCKRQFYSNDMLNHTSAFPLRSFLPTTQDAQSHAKVTSSILTGPEVSLGELSLRLVGPVVSHGEDEQQVKAGCMDSLSKSSPDALSDLVKERPVLNPQPKLQNGRNSNGGIDAELVAMAAATVARAKAAAANIDDQLCPGRHHAEASPCTESEPPGFNVKPPLPDGVPPLPACKVVHSKESSHDTRSNSFAVLTNADKASLGNAAIISGSIPKNHGSPCIHAISDIPVAHQQSVDGSAALSRVHLSLADPRQLAITQSPCDLAPSDAQAPGHAFVASPQLSLIVIPDNLDPAAMTTWLSIWSIAAHHYQRAQRMHDCALQQAERQWQRCKAQVQMLQAEELKARSLGRLSEAGAVNAALAKWKQRAGHLDTAMRRHRQEYVRHKSLVERAMVMAERLQVMAAAITSTGSALGRNIKLDSGNLLLKLLPRLPEVMLADCGVMQPLERLHGELVQQVAALHATVAGLQQQSQRLFGKASRRSSKLKVQRGANDDTASHALALAKSQSAAEQSAALGERAVELAAHARTVQEIAESLSNESANCLHILERLQHACDQELLAQHALVQAADLILCEAMQAVIQEQRAGSLGMESFSRAKLEATDSKMLLQLECQAGDFDSLMQAQHLPGACLSAARVHARRGEDLAQDVARAIQIAKEQLELQMGPFSRHMAAAAAAVAAIASARSTQCDALRTQVDAAAVCVARARSKLAAQRVARDAEAAEKYSRAAEGWAKQTEKLKKEVLVTAAASEELAVRGEALAKLGGRLQPIQAALDAYLDQQLEVWAAATLGRI